MRKYKLGFIVGAMLFSIIPASAAIEEFICYRADYKVMVNGSEYINPDLPILNYKGNTYAPFRSILEKAGLNVNWNAELKQAEVTSNPTSAQISSEEGSSMNTATTIEYDPVTGLPVGAEYVENEKDGRSYKTIKYNGEIYISMVDLKTIFGIENKFIDGLGVCFYKDENLILTDSNDKTNHFFVNSRLYYKKTMFESYIGE